MANAALAIGALHVEKRVKSSAKADRAVYAHVTERDPICRGCHMAATTDRHHLLGRKITSKESVCGVCDECHDGIHPRIGGKTLKISGDAEKRSAWGMACGLTVERLTRAHGWVTWCDR